LHQDVENFQCGLQALSAFPFEIFLHRIKKMVRKSHQPINQIAKRIKEMETSSYNFASKVKKTKIQPNVKTDRNSWFLLKNNKICEIVNLKKDQEFEVKLYSFNRSLSYFDEPVDSKLLKICLLPKQAHFQTTHISEHEILQKFVAIPDKDGVLLIPMLHTNF